MSIDDETRRRILERRAQFIRAAIASAGIGTATVALNACDNPMAQPCLEPLPVSHPPSAQPCLEPMPPQDASPPDATPNPSSTPSASANTSATPVSGASQAPSASAKTSPAPPPTPTQTVVKPPPLPCLKPVSPLKNR